MQVFLPYADFEKSVSVLDNKRLGNQIYRECLTLINGGWKNHPCSKMWFPTYIHSLAKYAIYGLIELQKRGKNYPHHMKTFIDILDNSPDNGDPKWLGNLEFHRSHQSNLLRKNPVHYGKYFSGVPSDLPYVWPTNNI